MSSEAEFRRAVARYRRAQEQLEGARIDLRGAMEAARRDGLTFAAMAEQLGVSRQRVMRILDS